MENDCTNNQHLDEIRGFMEDNLEAFKKKFILFFIGLCAFAIGIIINAFGAIIGTVFVMAGMVAWGAPLVVKFWFSGFGALFDFQYKVYEIDRYGNKRDVSHIDSVLAGPFMKCMAALVVLALAMIIVPVEMIVRLFNHMRFEKELGIKNTAVESPRREAILCAIVILAMIVIATIGNMINTKIENTSDLGNEDKLQLIETVESKLTSYRIHTGMNRIIAEVKEEDGKVTFVAMTGFEWVGYPHDIDIHEYTEIKVPSGTYVYENGAWNGVSKEVGFVLSHMTLSHYLTLDEMKEQINDLVVKKNVGFSYRISEEECNFYYVKIKDGKDDGSVVGFLVDENYRCIEPNDNHLGAFYIFN